MARSTDLAAFDPGTGQLRFAKSLTTPPNLEQCVLDCSRLAGIDASTIATFRHGTTVVINALLERKGARTALITTEGFREHPGDRPRQPPGSVQHPLFVAPAAGAAYPSYGNSRTNGRGGQRLETGLDRAALAALAERLIAEKIEAVAVCLLHAWRNPSHELEIGDDLRARTDCFVSCSHEIAENFAK